MRETYLPYSRRRDIRAYGIYLMGLMGLAILELGNQTQAQVLDDPRAFDSATMVSAKPSKRQVGECLSFEAIFNEPVKSQDVQANLDIEKNFTTFFSRILRITQVTEKKLRMVLTASTEDCPEKSFDHTFRLSTSSSQSADRGATQILPQEFEFTGKEIWSIK